MEVMVALAVVTIALMAVYRMHSQTLFMDASGRTDTVATLLARQVLAGITDDATAELTDDSGEFSDAYAGYGWRIQAEDVASDLVKEDGPRLKRITLTITAPGQTEGLTLVTYRHRYE
jgi:general secretion pathway protein I